jgi:hypothetical protein
LDKLDFYQTNQIFLDNVKYYMKDIGFIISMAIWLGYCYLTIVNSSRQKDKYYYKLFETRTFLLHLLGAVLLGLIGVWRVTNFDAREFMYFGPLVYLLFLRLFNYLTIFIYGRPIILATRWDSPPNGKNGIKFYDKFVGLILLLIPIGGGLIILKWIQSWS